MVGKSKNIEQDPPDPTMTERILASRAGSSNIPRPPAGRVRLILLPRKSNNKQRQVSSSSRGSPPIIETMIDDQEDQDFAPLQISDITPTTTTQNLLTVPQNLSEIESMEAFSFIEMYRQASNDERNRAISHIRSLLRQVDDGTKPNLYMNKLFRQINVLFEALSLPLMDRQNILPSTGKRYTRDYKKEDENRPKRKQRGRK